MVMHHGARRKLGCHEESLGYVHHDKILLWEIRNEIRESIYCIFSIRSHASRGIIMIHFEIHKKEKNKKAKTMKTS